MSELSQDWHSQFPPNTVMFNIDQEVFDAAISKAIMEMVKSSVDLKYDLDLIIQKYVGEMSENSPYHQMIRDEITSILSRFPMIAMDQELRTKIALTIVDHHSTKPGYMR